MSYRIAYAIRDIDETRWDAVAGTRITMTHRWQRVLETSWKGYQPRYLLLDDARGPLAIMIANASDSFNRSGWQEQIMERAILMLRPPISKMHSGVLVRPDASLSEVLPQLEQALRMLAANDRRPLLGVNNVAADELPIWRAQRFLAVSQPAVPVLDLHWPSYKQYVAALPAKQRSELRRMRRRAMSTGLRFEHGPLRVADDRLYPLLRDTFLHHGAGEDAHIFAPTIFDRFAAELPEDVIVFKGLLGDRLAGYLIGVRDGATLGWWLSGLDDALGRPSYLYFLLIDEMIQWSIAHGYRSIFGGLWNYREKRKFGFELQPRWLCLRANVGPLNALLSGAFPLAQRVFARNIVRS